MEDGARRRGGSEKGSASPDKSEGGGVALKKEIGLLSACGIIVGEWGFWWDVILPVWTYYPLILGLLPINRIRTHPGF